MNSQLSSRVSALMGVGQVVTNRLAVLVAVLAFFLLVYCLKVVLKKDVSFSKVTGTIKLALLGLALLVLETQLGAAPAYASLVGSLQSLVVMLCLANLVAYLIIDIYCYYRMKRQVPSFVRDLLTLLVYVAFALTSLRIIFQIDVSSIVTTTTVLTAAVAFAMQATIANVISGFYVENDDNLKRDTWIAIKELDIAGQIVNVGFRYVTLRTLDNQRVMVPNNYIMQNIVLNLGNRGEGERTAVHLKVGLGYDLPPEKAIALMTQILSREEHIEKQPAPVVLVSGFLDSSIEYNLKYFLDDYASHMPTKGSVLNKVWYAITREGYSFPFPTREVISRSPREAFTVDEKDLLGVLRRTDILRTLADEELQRLSGRVHRKVFGTGEVVVQQHDQGDSLFVVRRGRLDVHIDDAVVGSLREGEIFGEMSLLTGEKRRATVIAASEVHLVELSKEHFEPVIRANPDLLERLSAILAQREEANIESRKRAELTHVGVGSKEAFMKRLRAFFNL